MVDDTGIFLSCTAEESGNVNQRQNLDVESIAEAYETCGLTACIAVKHTCQPSGLVGDDTCGTSVEAGKTADDVLGIILMHLHEITIINDEVDNLVHIIRFVGVSRQDIVEGILLTHRVVGAFYELTRRRTVANASSSVAATKWVTPDLVAWIRAPPSCSTVTSSLVTDFTIFGPVMNI